MTKAAPSATPANIMRDFWRNPVTVVLSTILLFFGAQIIAAFTVAPFYEYLPSQNFKLLSLVAANTLALLILISILMNVLKFRWSSIGLRWTPIKYILWALPALLIYLMVSLGLSSLAAQFIPGFNVEQTQEIGFMKAGGSGDLAAAFFSLVILTPLFEEIIFRGVLFKGLRRKLSFGFSAVIASAIFALAHGQWNVAIDTFALGLALSYLVEKSDSIVPAILLHALKNGIAFLFLFVLAK